MIRFLHTRGHAYTFRHIPKPCPGLISLMGYDALLRARWLLRATYVFTDLDRLSPWDLELASEIYLQLKNTGLPVLNNPARVKTRYALSRALHAAGLNDFNIHRADELDDAVCYPVFVRKSHGHREPLSDLLHTRDDLQRTIDEAVTGGTPLENLIVIEFAAEPVRDGIYRKLAAFRIGDKIVPHYSVHDTAWLVKYGRKFDNIEDLYAQEGVFLETNPFAEHLTKAFDIAGIDYGRADFGFHRGRIQIYEINTNPSVFPPSPHPSAQRIQNMHTAWNKYLDGLRVLDTDVAGWPVRLADGKLQRQRPWKNLFVRTRKAQ